MNIKVIGIDLAKSVFQVAVQLEDNSIASNRQIRRRKLLDTIRQYPPGTLVAMESCGGANFWGRTIRDMGYRVLLLPAQYVKQYAGHQKSDARDAIAICETAFRPEVHPVAIKSVDQVDIKSLRLVRERGVRSRTALMNEMRAIAYEYGVVFPKSMKGLLTGLADALESGDNDLSLIVRGLLSEMRDELKQINERVDELTAQVVSLCRQHPRYQALQSIPGFGPLLAAAFVSEVGNGSQFKTGRQVSAWCGVVPRHFGTGGKIRLGAITKHGDATLRTLLVHGARAVATYVNRREDPLGTWLRALIARRGKNRAVVALANKMARIGWRVLTSDKAFDMQLAFKAA